MKRKILLLYAVWLCLAIDVPSATTAGKPSSTASEIRTAIGPYGGDVRGLDVDPANPKEIYASTYEMGQVFGSKDGGKTWKSLAAFDSRLYSVAVAPSDPKEIYALGEQGIFASADKGATWTERAFGTRRSSTGQIVVHPKSPDEIYIAGAYQTDSSSKWMTRGAVLKSLNGGKTWTVTRVATTLKRGALTCLAISKKHPSTLYAGGYGYDSNYKLRGGVYRSDNSGKSWKDVSPYLRESVSQVAVDSDNPNRVFAAAGNTILRSLDGGASWTPKTLESISSVAIDPAQSSVVYAGGWGIMFRSLDGGLQWTRFSGLGGNAQFILVGSSRILTATSAGIFKSENKGQNWTTSQTGLCAAHIQTLAVAPSSSQIVYAVIPDVGLYKTVNGGKSWLKIGSSLTCGNIFKIIVHPDNPNWIFASAFG